MIRRALLTFFVILPAAAWEPRTAPLMTRWAKDVSPTKVHPDYPRPQLVRKTWSNLNGLWDYAITPRGETAPGNYQGQILVPFPVESALSGVMKTITENDEIWYRRRIELPKDWEGQRVLLHFGAVDFEATLWVNGQQVGQHRGGYDAFSFDITDAAKVPGTNEIVVRVWDPSDAHSQPRGKQVRTPDKRIFYTASSGIWQTVWLEPVPAAHITSLKITPDIDHKSVTIYPTVMKPDPAHKLRIAVLDKAQEVYSQEWPLGKPIKLPIKSPKLWSPENPFLYDLVVSLRKDAREIDSVSSYFGMRQISLNTNGITRIAFNNEPLFMMGILDQGYWPDGLYTAPADEGLKHDLEMAKKLGFNLVRKHAKVEPARWYYWCDRLGLLVWQDMPGGDRFINPRDPDAQRTPESAYQFEAELRAMIDTHYNHPSIVMWVIFNVGWGQYDTVRIAQWAKEYDPTRLIDSASGWVDRGVGDVHDWHRYPTPDSPLPENTRAAVLGEYGGLGLPVPGHSWGGATWGYRGVESRDRLTRQYTRLMRRVYELKDVPGLSAAVYTQLTDVEYEGNGLFTYDRQVLKVDANAVSAVNHGRFPAEPRLEPLSPIAEDQMVTWRYTTVVPGENWSGLDFNDSAWQQGPAGFGTAGTPSAIVGTEWRTRDIWLRREFTHTGGKPRDLRLMIHHDDTAEVFINGVPAVELRGFTTAYEEFDVSEEAVKALKSGRNVLAVHCHQIIGGQYIDVGLFKAE